VTGCLKIAHQSIFTGANNFKLNGLDDEKYAGFFGFTRFETEKLLNDCGLAAQAEAVRDWYDGYRIGNEHMFCPWSVLSFCDKALGCQHNITPEPFWVNTSGNDAINLYLKNIVNENLTQDIQRMEELLNNVPQEITLQEFERYPDIGKIDVGFDTCMTLLLQTGYLTFTEDSPLHENVFLKIPNKEVLKCFELKLKIIYASSNPAWLDLGEKLFLHLLANEANDAEEILNLLLGQFISIRNSGNELFYHGFMLGLLSMVAARDKIKLESDQETGDGYSDIIISHKQLKTIVIMELKKTENSDKKRLSAAKDATKQIIRKKYVDGFDNTKYLKIYGLGIGFGGKSCAIETLGNLLEMS
ncbi:MAG: PD-(D/E)XK nuclease domain-containing protein, partial [Desulfovibrionaceae bacterium]|nr:PD-(D/E)XK nuclease domain-containing protein [Desulfovibrionaceae bacterium]